MSVIFLRVFALDVNNSGKWNVRMLNRLEFPITNISSNT